MVGDDDAAADDVPVDDARSTRPRSTTAPIDDVPVDDVPDLLAEDAVSTTGELVPVGIAGLGEAANAVSSSTRPRWPE